jgi:hypothetical protein
LEKVKSEFRNLILPLPLIRRSSHAPLLTAAARSDDPLAAGRVRRGGIGLALDWNIHFEPLNELSLVIFKDSIQTKQEVSHNSIRGYGGEKMSLRDYPVHNKSAQLHGSVHNCRLFGNFNFAEFFPTYNETFRRIGRCNQLLWHR